MLERAPHRPAQPSFVEDIVPAAKQTARARYTTGGLSQYQRKFTQSMALHTAADLHSSTR
jgi:hypothetical protein